MIRLSVFSGLLYSAQLEVNETPSVDGIVHELQDEALQGLEPSALRRAYKPLLLFSAGLVAYAQRRGPSARESRNTTADTSSEDTNPHPQAESPRMITPCKEAPNTPSTPSTSSTNSPQKGKGKVSAPPKGLGKGPAKGPAKGPPSGTPKGKAGPKGKGTPPKGALASQCVEDVDDARVVNPFGTRRIRWKSISDQSGTVFDGLDILGIKKCPDPEANRAQQLAIAFRRSPLPLQKLCSALQTLDFSIPLSEEEIEGLLKAWPTDIDFRQVAKHTGPAEELRDVEQCIRQVAAVPRSEARLKLLRLSRSLDSLTIIFERIATLQTACDELMKSEKLQVLLQEALRVGNYINGDPGAGFALDAFIQLRSLKGVGGATPLHCLCAGCAQEDPTFSATLHSELANLPLSERESISGEGL
ncbi:FH12 [Symbiodinium pilosum]|uniref:FH12 protein n=1 Tax=Symbiodinium pilosum TaxID=2952 RepID=A0A812W9C1_SYMPI|nr:FH12 [Symbiodinium pilosum]